MHAAITIPKAMTQGTDLVVLSRKEYERLQHHVSELEDALTKIRRGEKEYRKGKTRVIKSLSTLRG